MYRQSMHIEPDSYRDRACTWMAAGLITTVPTTAEEAKKLGEDLIKTKGGEMLSKVSGTCSCAI